MLCYFVVTTIALASSSVLANGFISCEDYDTSSHVAYYSFDLGQHFTCPVQPGTCEGLIGDGAWQDEVVTCTGNEHGTEQTAFWITSDGCYNICSGGNHMFCCRYAGEGIQCPTSGISGGC